MNAGYVRLSRDDDHRNYVSIENQKLIISRAAASMGLQIDCWYEDDGYSGYKFDRPGFVRLMQDLERQISLVFVKDLSRLGRNNGKVLSLLDMFQETGKRLIAIDDDYDSLNPEDDIIGIKTWYNERYIKDTSRKIRRVLSARQKEGTLFVAVPFGYTRDPADRETIRIVPEEADCVREIYRLYLQGYGYRRLAALLNERHIPTPSLSRHLRKTIAGRTDGRTVCPVWSDGMVKSILDNDFYAGNYRLHKRARTVIHGNDHRIPREEQYLFEHHHPAIIKPAVFAEVQSEKSSRIRTHYRGSSAQKGTASSCGLFSDLLFCSDCAHRLTPVTRRSGSSIRQYFLCSTYNARGRSACASSHMISLELLLACVDTLFSALIYSCKNAVARNDIPQKDTGEESCEELQTDIQKEQALLEVQLQVLLMQKSRDLAAHPAHAARIQAAYAALEDQVLSRLQDMKEEAEYLAAHKADTAPVLLCPCDILQSVMEQHAYTHRDLTLLIRKITVDAAGSIDIYLNASCRSLRMPAQKNKSPAE